MEIIRGDIVICALSSDYEKPRHAVVVQSDLFNATHASITICTKTKFAKKSEHSLLIKLNH